MLRECQTLLTDHIRPPTGRPNMLWERHDGLRDVESLASRETHVEGG